ncbi:hypothetical protein MGAST_20465 [Mycobacterium gastri 'Wayne']|nr:hypothetical protein MGAST_20465 [Mycobacterium gastri 'Wayne']
MAAAAELMDRLGCLVPQPRLDIARGDGAFEEVTHKTGAALGVELPGGDAFKLFSGCCRCSQKLLEEPGEIGIAADPFLDLTD